MRPGVALIAAGAGVLAGCGSGGVPVPVPAASGSPGSATVARTCAALHAALPATVLGGDRRDTDPVSDRTAAWGDDPTVTLACGVPEPARASSSADLVEIDGAVSWLPVPGADGSYDLYPYGRMVWVRVHVPRTARDPVDAASALTAAIARTVPAA